MAYCWRFEARTGRTIVLVLGRYQTKEKAASGGLLYFGEFPALAAGIEIFAALPVFKALV